MANRIMLNETSYHGAGAIQEIATEAIVLLTSWAVAGLTCYIVANLFIWLSLQFKGAA